MPTEMKNRPSRMSRNGRITDSIWWRYSVSASIIPERKAPSAKDSPALCETQAELSTTSSTVRVNSSRSRLCAITWNSGRSSQRPAASTAMMASMPPSTGTTLAPRAQRPGAAHQHRGQGEEGHEGQVLEQQHAEGEPPVRAVQLRALGELLQQDGGRAHRDRPAEHDRHQPWHPEQVADDGEHRGGEQHLRAAEHEDLAAHGDHARQRELQSQREQQEGDPEVGEQARRARVRQDPKRMRAEQQADHQVGGAGRQRQAPRERDEEHRAGEQDQALGEGREHWPQVRPCERAHATSARAARRAGAAGCSGLLADPACPRATRRPPPAARDARGQARVGLRGHGHELQRQHARPAGQRVVFFRIQRRPAADLRRGLIDGQAEDRGGVEFLGARFAHLRRPARHHAVDDRREHARASRPCR